MTFDNSNKKPKFLEKFSAFLTSNHEPQRQKNLIDEFSPLTVNKHKTHLSTSINNTANTFLSNHLIADKMAG